MRHCADMSLIGASSRKFKVLVEGHNLHLFSENHNVIEVLGFYTTRCVEARDESEAGRLAMVSVVEELQTLGTRNSATDQPSMRVVELEEVRSFSGLPRRGFTFFPEEKETCPPILGNSDDPSPK